MQIKTLKVFCDVIRLKNFSRAAAANGITQSMASQAVNLIEKKMGKELIDRTKRPWRITNAGKIFYEGLSEILDRYSELERKISGETDYRINKTIRIASIYSAGLRHMKHFVQRYALLYPDIKVHLEYLHPDRVYETVAGDENDIGIVSFPSKHNNIFIIPWRVEPFAVACYPGHPLAGAGKISIKKINGEKIIHFDRGLVIRRKIDRYLKSNDVAVDVALEFDNIESIKRAVEIQSGIALLPFQVLDTEAASGSLVRIPLIEKDFTRPLGIILRNIKKHSSAVSNFVDLLKKEKDDY